MLKRISHTHYTINETKIFQGIWYMAILRKNANHCDTTVFDPINFQCTSMGILPPDSNRHQKYITEVPILFNMHTVKYLN